MAGMFGDRFEVQTALDDRLFKEALNVGQLSSYGVGQMAAYQDGMMGSPFEAALADKFSPEMQKQNLLDELQRKHPNPDTPEKLMALANDLTSAGFGDMAQTVRLEATKLSAAVEKEKYASKDEISVIANTLTLTQGSDMMLDQYLKEVNGTEAFDELKPADLTSRRAAVRNQFTHIIKGYEAYLGTRKLKPSDVNKLMFSNEGELENLKMFKLYTSKLAGTNKFAKYIFDNNEILIGSMNTTKKTIPKGDPDSIKIPDESINAESHVTQVAGELDADGEVITESVSYVDLSKNDKIELNNKVSADIIRKLSDTYRSMVDLGIFPDDELGGEDLRQEQQDDSHQAWIGGTMMGKFGFTPMRTKNGAAYKHFKSQPKERFAEYLLDPEAYYKKYIVMNDGVMRDDTSQEVISLWGLN